MSQPPILQLIPLTSIHPSPYQYRTQFDDAKQKELIESLRATGLSTPFLVRIHERVRAGFRGAALASRQRAGLLGNHPGDLRRDDGRRGGGSSRQRK
jgi:hypothetical protein